MNGNKITILSLVFWMLCTILASGVLNADVPVEVRAQAIPATAHIGDEIRFKILVNRPKLFTVDALPDSLDLAPFEIKSVDRNSVSKRGRIYETFTLTLTIFELGDHVIKPIGIRVRDPQGMVYDIPTSIVRVQIKSVGADAAKSTEIRPIKGPASADWTLGMNLVLGAIILLLGALLGYLIWRRKHACADPDSLKSPDERVRLELDRLRQKDYLSHGDVRRHADELCDILRRYLWRRYRIDAMEMTTAELLPRLKEMEIPPAVLPELKEFFESADLAKFAKVELPRPRLEAMEGELVSIVDVTREVPKET